MEWIAKIKDELSGSATRMKQSLVGLKSELKAVDGATAMVQDASQSLKHTQDQYLASQKRLEAATHQRVGAEKAEAAAMHRLQTLESQGTKDKRQLVAAKKKLAAAAKDRATAEKAEKKAAADVASANTKQEKSARELRQAYARLGSEKQKLAAATDKSKKKFVGLGEASGKLANVLSGALVAGTAAAVLGIGKLTWELGKLGIGFAKSVAEGADLARTTRNMFAGAAGGNMAAGRQAFEDIHELALRTGEDFVELRKEYGTLKSVGVEGKLLEDLLRLRAATKGISEEAESGWGKFTDAMVEGEVTASQFEDVTKLIAQGEHGRERFGKQLGLSAKALEENQSGVAQLAIELKKLDPQEFLRISAAFADANMDLDGMSRGAKTFGERLSSAWDYFTREVGKGVEFDVEGMVGGLVDWMKSDDGVVIMKNMATAAQDIAAGLEVAGKFASALFVGFTGGSTEVEGTAQAIKDLASEENLDAARELGGGIRWLIVQIGNLIGTAGEIKLWATESLVGSIMMPINLLYTLGEAGYNAGRDLVQGIASGIKATATAPITALSGVADSLKAILPTKFDMHSPSRVMEKQSDDLMRPLEKRVGNDNAVRNFDGVAEAIRGSAAQFDSGSAIVAGEKKASNDNAFRGFEGLANSMLGTVTNTTTTSAVSINLGGLHITIPEGTTVDSDELIRNVEPKLEEMVRNLMSRVA
jgi:hypothetical protein